MDVRQVVPWRHWPSGDSRPLAVLAIEPPGLADRDDQVFGEDVDDLDRYRLAAIALGDGQQAWLITHDGDPNPGTVVLVDAAADVGDSLRLVAHAFALTPELVLRTAPVLAAAARERRPPVGS